MERWTRIPDSTNYRLNSFRLEGLDQIQACYRIIHFCGLSHADPDYERKLRLLCRLLTSDLRLPVEPITVGGEHALAVAGTRGQLQSPIVPEKKALTPECLSLRLDEEVLPLRFDLNRHKNTRPLLEHCLRWAVDHVFGVSGMWWSYGNRYVRRIPDEEASTAELWVMPAVYYGFVPGSDGFPELVLDPSVCYVSRRSLYAEYGDAPPRSLKGQHFLYKFGRQWYKIDALGIGGKTNAVEIVASGDRPPITVHQYVLDTCQGSGLPELEGLPPEAFTVQYKTGGERTRFAHSGLLFRLPKADHRSGVHPRDSEPILPPEVRGYRSEQLIEIIAGSLRMFDAPLRPTRRMRTIREGELHRFSPPNLRFAGDQEITTSLGTAGRDRFDALTGLGPAEATPFHDEQLVALPASLPVSLRQDFCRRFAIQIQELYGQTYQPQLLSYADSAAFTLREQARAIECSLANRNGYALLLLPRAQLFDQRRLHNYLKRKLWPRVQTQCAREEKLRSFYSCLPRPGGQEWVVRSGSSRDYSSYLRQLALAYLVVNRKWLWKLGKGTLIHDVHIGIDVYKGTAAVAFVYGDADLIAFEISKANRQECLSAQQLAGIIDECLRRDLPLLGMQPRSIVIYRDGNSYEPELLGIDRAVRSLQRSSLLPADIKSGVVEVRKRSAIRARLYQRTDGYFCNPEMGAAHVLGSTDAVLATTGAPMLSAGTAQPLYLVLKQGDLVIAEVAHDANALSHLAYTAPGKCHRLLFPIALCDLVLRDSTPGEEDELWEETAEDSLEDVAEVLGERKVT